MNADRRVCFSTRGNERNPITPTDTPGRSSFHDAWKSVQEPRPFRVIESRVCFSTRGKLPHGPDVRKTRVLGILSINAPYLNCSALPYMCDQLLELPIPNSVFEAHIMFVQCISPKTPDHSTLRHLQPTTLSLPTFPHDPASQSRQLPHESGFIGIKYAYPPVQPLLTRPPTFLPTLNGSTAPAPSWKLPLLTYEPSPMLL